MHMHSIHLQERRPAISSGVTAAAADATTAAAKSIETIDTTDTGIERVCIGGHGVTGYLRCHTRKVGLVLALVMVRLKIRGKVVEQLLLLLRLLMLLRKSKDRRDGRNL